MNGQEKLGSIAFVVSICVIIGFAIVFSILFALYGYYKIKNIKNGHENITIETTLKKRYKKIINNPHTFKEDNNLYYELNNETKESKTYLRVDDTDTLEENVKETTIHTVYDSIIDDKKRNRKFQIIYNIFFGILYAALLVIFGFALGFRLGGEQLFFGNTTLMTIQTGSMETINDDNTYTRNKIRNELIPYIQKEFNPNIIETIDRLSELVLNEENYMEKVTEKSFKEIVIDEKNNYIILDLKKFNSLEYVIKARLILYITKKIFGSSNGIEKTHVEDIIKLCGNNKGNKYLMPNKHYKITVKNKKIYCELQGKN